MSTKRKPSYTLEFKQDAAKLILDQDYTYIQAAKNLGISESALRRWVDAERKGSIKTSQGLSGQAKTHLNLSDHDELLRLRKEVTRLKMERELLKKLPSSLRRKPNKVRVYSAAREDLSGKGIMYSNAG